MVIWEITLGTAYFLGLSRTYRLALRLQRRCISPNHPGFRQFVHRRTRAVFNVAVKVHKKIQERDRQLGRKLGNWILGLRDKVKPPTGIVPPPKSLSSTNTLTSKTPTSFKPFKPKTGNQELDGHNIKFTSLNNMLHNKPFSPIAMMIQAAKPVGTNIQTRQLSLSSGVLIRDDIRQWMLRN